MKDNEYIDKDSIPEVPKKTGTKEKKGVSKKIGTKCFGADYDW